MVSHFTPEKNYAIYRLVFLLQRVYLGKWLDRVQSSMVHFPRLHETPDHVTVRRKSFQEEPNQIPASSPSCARPAVAMRGPRGRKRTSASVPIPGSTYRKRNGRVRCLQACQSQPFKTVTISFGRCQSFFPLMRTNYGNATAAATPTRLARSEATFRRNVVSLLQYVNIGRVFLLCAVPCNVCGGGGGKEHRRSRFFSVCVTAKKVCSTVLPFLDHVG